MDSEHLTTSCITENNNLETFSLIWFDLSVNDVKDNIEVQQKLRSSINCLKQFEDIDECEQYIGSLSNDEHVILIIDGCHGQQLVSRIHQFQQVFSIYIYCTSKARDEEWIKPFRKIKGAFVQLDQLVTEILSSQSRNKIGEALSFHIFNTTNTFEQSTTSLNGQFVHAQLLIDSLVRFKSTSTDKDELMAMIYKEYEGNGSVTTIIREFERDYVAERALWWYTRETFLYRLLNKALRVQNIDVLFLLRFFIQDLRQQLDQYQCLSSICVYRGQLISNEEFNLLKNSIGEFIAMNSFLSTSFDRNLAVFFLGTADGLDINLQRVLFEIHADPALPGVKSFADITAHSYMGDEQEVLIMLGAIFRIVDIHEDEEDHIWIIHLTLCDNSDQDLKAVMNHLAYELEEEEEETTLSSFSALLHRMGKVNESKKYFHRLLKELPSDEEEHLFCCYHNLGMVAMDKGDYDLSLSWHNKSLEIMMNTLESDDLYLADSYTCIGCVYDCKEDYKQALQWYKKALSIFMNALGEEHQNVAHCLNNMGLTYQKEKDLSEALACHQKALAIYTICLPVYHPNLGQSHKNIGHVYSDLDNTNLALEHYMLSLQIYEKSLPPQHPTIASLLVDIGDITYQKNEFQQALLHYEKAAIIYRQILPDTDVTLLNIEEYIRNLVSLISVS